MKILVVGSGGREHALAWKIKQSPLVKKIFCAPGNAGIAECAECVDIKADNIAGLLAFATKERIDLTVVGPEAALVLGIVDEFTKAGLKIFGPTKAASQLEGSKVFAKQCMAKYGVPTAKFRIFTKPQEAKDYIEAFNILPIVIKADGLAAGKGVVVAVTVKEALVAVDEMMVKKVFAAAGERIIIEECLVGEEASILAISDGENFIILDSAQDYKRIFDNDKGPNTGGMGAYSPAPVVTKELLSEVEKKVFKPIIDGMRADGLTFRGVLYAGIMITKEGPKVLEFNVRFGDPETQALLPRLKSDLVDVMLEAVNGKLSGAQFVWDNRTCVCVVAASGGYPGAYEQGKAISGLDEFKSATDVIIFHAGTKQKATDGKKEVVTAGGRVLGITGLGNDIASAVDTVYQAAKKVRFENMHFRTDIGQKALKK